MVKKFKPRPRWWGQPFNYSSCPVCNRDLTDSEIKRGECSFCHTKLDIGDKTRTKSYRCYNCGYGIRNKNMKTCPNCGAPNPANPRGDYGGWRRPRKKTWPDRKTLLEEKPKTWYTPKTKAKEIFNRITSPVDDFIKKKKSPPKFPSEEKLPYECKNCGYRFSVWDKDEKGNLVCPNCGAPKLRFYEHGGLRIEKKELKNYFKCPVCGSRDIEREGDKFKCKECGYIGEPKEFRVKKEEREEGTFSEIMHSSFTPVAIAAFIGLMIPVIFGANLGTALIAVGIIFLGLSKI